MSDETKQIGIGELAKRAGLSVRRGLPALRHRGDRDVIPAMSLSDLWLRLSEEGAMMAPRPPEVR
jgi:hypothetical protein